MLVSELPTPPVPLYVGLSLSAPSGEGPGIEVTGGGYERLLLQFVTPSDEPTALCNATTLEWPRATRLWGDIGWLTLWDLDQVYIGYGQVVDVITERFATTVRIDRGDVARAKAGDVVIRDGTGPTGPRVFGMGGYGIERYSRTGRVGPPRPYGVGAYGVGPYSRSLGLLWISGTLTGSFAPALSPCPGGSNWQMEALPA